MAVGNVTAPGKRAPTGINIRGAAGGLIRIFSSAYGPAIGALGSTVATRVEGGTAQQAGKSGLMSYLGGGAGGTAGQAAGQAIGNQMGGQVGKAGPVGSSPSGPMARRFQAKSADPNMAVNGGLNYLRSLPPESELRQKYTPVLVRAQMAGERKA